MGGSIGTPIVVVFPLLSAPIAIIGGTLSALRPRPLPIHAAGRRGEGSDGCDGRLDEIVEVCDLAFEDIHSHTGVYLGLPGTCPEARTAGGNPSTNSRMRGLWLVGISQPRMTNGLDLGKGFVVDRRIAGCR